MSKRGHAIIAVLLASGILRATAANADNASYKPAEGYVPNAETAIKIAVAVWEPIYGKRHIAGEKPYHAELKGGVWRVYGSLPSGSVGGTAIAEIAKDDGRILLVIHEQ